MPMTPMDVNLNMLPLDTHTIDEVFSNRDLRQRIFDLKRQQLTAEANSGMVIICKPEQSGNTFVMLEDIKNGITLPTYDKPVINVVFCDKKLLLTLQTSKCDKGVRVSETGESYLEFSSPSRTKYNSVEAVCGCIDMQKIYNVLCCTNKKRVRDIERLVIDFESKLRGQYAFKIWLDEADKYCNHIEQTFKPLVERYKDVSLYCITSTPPKLFSKFDDVAFKLVHF